MHRVKRLANRLVIDLKPFSKKIEIAGSIRRKASNPRDIDILIVPRDKNGILQYFKSIDRKEKGKLLGAGGMALNAEVDGVGINIIFTSQPEWAPSLLHFTGPKGANIWKKRVAKDKGYILNRHGLFDKKTKRRIPTPTEYSIYKHLDMTYRPPEMRGKKR